MLMNAAGTCKSVEVARDLALNDAVSEVNVGSYTPEPRVGFSNAYWYDKSLRTSYNAKQMPNVGLQAFLDGELPELQHIIKTTKKRLRISMAAENVGLFIYMVRKTFERITLPHTSVTFELNAVCGNDPATFNGHDPGFIEQLVHKLSNVERGNIRLALKQTPIALQTKLLDEMVRAIQYVPGTIMEIVTCNTYPDVYVSGADARFAHRGGFASMGGAGLHAIACGQAKAFRKALHRDMIVTGSGGISSFEHVRNFRMADADHVQVGTAFIEEGLQVFDRIGPISAD